MAKIDVANVSSAVSPGDGPWTPPQTKASARLTKRQRAVLAELATGASLKVTASNLSISVATVSTHLYRAKRKLDATSRNDLLATLVGASAKHYSVPLSIRCRVTKAELATCEAIIEGMSYGALARARGISIRTVQHQARSLFEKLGVTSRCELAALIFKSD
jgi:DNA-binding CsgD family transcriptional regulator